MSLKNVLRLDFRKLDKAEVTKEGYLLAPAYLTRVGVFTYFNADGSTRKEFRPPEEVFHPDSLASLSLVPVTDDHPKNLLDAKNTKRHIIGTTSEKIDQEDVYVKSLVKIVDQDAIDKVKAGKVELSCGYVSDLEETPGEYNGEKYDCIQRNIRYNHVSLVKKGRAGSQVRLRLDSEGSVIIEEDSVEKLTIDGKEFEVDSAVATAFKAEQKKHADAMEEAKKAKDEKEALQKAKDEEEAKLKEAQSKTDALQAKVDSLTEEVKKKTDSLSEDVIAEKVNKRITVLDTARFVLGSEAKDIEKKSNVDLMKEVIKKDSPEADLEGKTEVYVEARFDHIVESKKKEIEARKQFSQTLAPRKDAKDVPDSKKAREKMMEDAKNLSKPKAE